ncbi:MAG: MFS transporter [Caldilineaceae bacterium]
MRHLSALRELRVFTLLWVGQLISGLGSSLSGFAFGVWVFQKTGSATLFAVTTFAYVLPFALLAPLVGVLVDRWDRRWTMFGADVGQVCITMVIIMLLFRGQLAIWHVYIANVAGAILGSFHGAAYGASIVLLVPKQHLTRAAGLGQINNAVCRLVAPLLAGFLVSVIKLEGVVFIDLFTFLIAITTYLLLPIPRPTDTNEHQQGKGAFWQEMRFGWQYLLARPGLLGLVLMFALLNFFVAAASILTVPMVLSFAKPDAVGMVLAAGATGLLASGSLMSTWVGPKRRMEGALGLLTLGGFGLILAGWQPMIALIAAGRFLSTLAFAGSGALATVIEQRKVAPEVQGRVFGVEGMIALFFEALAYPIGGFFADHIFEPLMTSRGRLALILEQGIGMGPGRGMGAMNILMGVCAVALALLGYLHPRIRCVEHELPDARADNITQVK